MKNNLLRLPGAIRRELSESRQANSAEIRRRRGKSDLVGGNREMNGIAYDRCWPCGC